MIIIAKNYEDAKKLFKQSILKNYPHTTKCAIFVDEDLRKSILIDNQLERFNFKQTKKVKYNIAENAIDNILKECKLEDLYCMPATVTGLCIFID